MSVIELNHHNLPVNWDMQNVSSFVDLADCIVNVHESTQYAAFKAINKLATARNYIIGYYIVEYEQIGKDRAAYGEKVLKKLVEKVNIKGINETLLKNCRRFYLLYPQMMPYLSGRKSPTVSDKSVISPTESDSLMTPAEKLISYLSFSHLVEIMTIDDEVARFFYETESIKCCWSVKELRRQISTNLFYRCGISKKPALLLANTSNRQLAAFSIKEPFSFEFLGLRPDVCSETDLETALIEHLQEFLLELGKGFCFESRQKRMIIDDEYYHADLVFYNRILHCNVIIELKNDEFKHAYLSQLNAYVSYFRENEMHEGDNPPVGILMCTRKGEKMVEYALAGMDNHLFVSTYMLTLPDIEQLKAFIIKETSGGNYE